jgi:hypothetical protein
LPVANSTTTGSALGLLSDTVNVAGVAGERSVSPSLTRTSSIESWGKPSSSGGGPSPPSPPSSARTQIASTSFEGSAGPASALHMPMFLRPIGVAMSLSVPVFGLV